MKLLGYLRSSDEGYNWYDQNLISGIEDQQPGGANGMYQGFTGVTSDWTDARIPLDVLEGQALLS